MRKLRPQWCIVKTKLIIVSSVSLFFLLFWFFSPKNSRQNSCHWNDLDSIILLSLYNYCIMICNDMALVLFRIFGNSKKIIDFIDC